jgi:hypothetical protein
MRELILSLAERAGAAGITARVTVQLTIVGDIRHSSQ